MEHLNDRIADILRDTAASDTQGAPFTISDNIFIIVAGPHISATGFMRCLKRACRIIKSLK